MEDRKQETTQGGGWMSVPAFGEWDMKNGVPDYSMDFTKIREMRKQNKSDFNRASIGNEEDFVRRAGDGGGGDRRRDDYAQLPDNSVDAAPAHSPTILCFDEKIAKSLENKPEKMENSTWLPILDTYFGYQRE